MGPSPSGSPSASGVAIKERPPASAGQRVRVRGILLLALIVTFGYVVFLLAGFGKDLDTVRAYDVRPLPLYVYGGALLLLLQLQVIRSMNDSGSAGTGPRVSMLRILYTVVTSVFAIVYMGQALFFKGTNNITQQAATYIILNIVAIIVLLSDFAYRRTNRGRAAKSQVTSPDLESPFLNLAVDIAGIAAFCYLAWAILTVLATLKPAYVIVDIHQLGLPGITYLQDLDLVLALSVTAISLALAVMHGVFVNTTNVQRADTEEIFWKQLLRVARMAGWEGLGSMRLVLGPLIWLIPAYSIGEFAIQTTAYFRSAATNTGQGIWELFNPFSPSSIQNYGMGLQVIVLALVAAASVIVASVVVEHNFAIFRRTLEMLRDAGRAVTLTLALFLLSLAVINAVAVIVRPKTAEPFQLGAATLFALILAIVPPLVERLRHGFSRRR